MKRDSRIEYTEQVARIQLAPAENPETILAGAERVAFGASGCGIDWQKADTTIPYQCPAWRQQRWLAKMS